MNKQITLTSEIICFGARWIDLILNNDDIMKAKNPILATSCPGFIEQFKTLLKSAFRSIFALNI